MKENKQLNIQQKQNYPDSVASYDTQPVNEVGLFYNGPEHQTELTSKFKNWNASYRSLVFENRLLKFGDGFSRCLTHSSSSNMTIYKNWTETAVKNFVKPNPNWKLQFFQNQAENVFKSFFG